MQFTSLKAETSQLLLMAHRLFQGVVEDSNVETP